MSAFIFGEIKIIDEKVYMEYRDLARKSIAEYGGTYTLRTGLNREALEGEWPDDDLFVMMRFDDVARAKEFYGSDSYAVAKKLAPLAMTRRLALYDSPDV